MRTVYKYPVMLEDEWQMSMPRGAKILSLDVQNGKPYMWAAIETTRMSERRYFITRGTGHELTRTLEFIGMFQLENMGLVFHVFERV